MEMGNPLHHQKNGFQQDHYSFNFILFRKKHSCPEATVNAFSPSSLMCQEVLDNFPASPPLPACVYVICKERG